jgi:putative addiction module antidote
MRMKVQKVGNSLGVIIPRDVAARLHVGHGDELFLSEAPGEVTLRVADPEVERQIEIGLDLIREHKDVLRALAK